MAKQPAPKLKEMSFYESINIAENPFNIIGDLIEDHNWVYVFNKERFEFEKVPTEVPFTQCKGCKTCDDIFRLGESLSDWKIAQIVLRPMDQWERRDLLWLLSQRYKLPDIIRKCKGGKKAFSVLIEEKFRTDDPEPAMDSFKYEIPKEMVMHLCGIDKYQYSDYYKSYLESHSGSYIGFTERASSGTAIPQEGVA